MCKEIQEKYDSILVFESPLTIGEDSVYGYVYNSTEFPYSPQNNKEYIEYLVGCKKWYDIGNKINEKYEWIDKSNGIYYDEKCPYIQNFCKEAYKEYPIAYFYKEGITFDYAEEDVDGPFIIGERFWNWAIGQMDDIVALDNYYYESMSENKFITLFENEMNRYDVSVDGDMLDLHFKVRDLEFILECPCELDESDCYRFCGWDVIDGDWHFMMFPCFNIEGANNIFLSFHIETDNMESFVKTVFRNADILCSTYLKGDKAEVYAENSKDDEDLPF